MDYREIPAPDPIRHLVKAAWALAAPGDPGEWLTHVATPDGCMEVIRRLEGRSSWGGEQPDCFVAGIIARPAELKLSGGSRFVGLRLWPWTWAALADRSPAALIDGWADLAAEAPGFAMPAAVDDCFAAVDPAAPGMPAAKLAGAILDSTSVAGMAAGAGLSPRMLQRWFERNVGLPPRTWLRLRRFSEAFAALPEAGALAGHAVDHGFADQAHMTREFRALAGATATRARRHARGPFIDGARN